MRPVGLWQAVAAVLIAPSVVGSLALLIADPGAGLLVGVPTLGVAVALWSARGGWLIAAGILSFMFTGFGAFMSFALGLGWADSGESCATHPCDAIGLAFLAFLIAMPATIAVVVVRARRPDRGRDIPAPTGADGDGDRPEARLGPDRVTVAGLSMVPLAYGAYFGYTSAHPWNSPGGLDELGRFLPRIAVLVLVLALGIAVVVGIAARAKARGLDTGMGRRRLAIAGAGFLGLWALGGFLVMPALLIAVDGFLLRAPVPVLVLALGIAVVVGIAARAKAGGQGARRGRLALGGASLLGLGALVGFLLTPVIGLPYSTPLVAFGSATARFDRLPTFVPDVGGYVECESVAGTAVSTVRAEVGKLRSGTLDASIHPDADGSADVSLNRQGGDNAQTWADQAEVVETSDGGASGRVTFQLPLVFPAEAEDDWPAVLSGELTWTCGKWLGPAANAADAYGRLDLHLDGVDWVPAQSGTEARCGIEADGSVGSLEPAPWADGAGLLHGTSVYPDVDLRAEHVAGSDVDAGIRLSGTDPPPGEQLPAWEGRVRLVEVADDQRAGRVAFTDMPRWVDPSGVPMSAGWPDSLTGELTWSC